MKCLIFCGGFGTRMNNGEPGNLKPLIEVGGKEILRHIISIYESFGINDFLLLGGYKIQDLYAFTAKYPNINLKVIDTGESTPTGGRLWRAKDYINSHEFLLTYGDSLTNFNLTECLNFKEKCKADFTISVFKKKLEYGILKINESSILEEIQEKTYSVKINAGFYILNHRVFDYINSDKESFETDILPRMLADKTIKIGCYEVGFWHPMDTPADHQNLDKILMTNNEIFFKP
jgi:glucose-1-phosphate cytidylyltransferase